jgi:hypothetical protein
MFFPLAGIFLAEIISFLALDVKNALPVQGLFATM